MLPKKFKIHLKFCYTFEPNTSNVNLRFKISSYLFMCSSNSLGLPLEYLHMGHCNVGEGLFNFNAKLDLRGDPSGCVEFFGLNSPPPFTKTYK